MKKIAYLITAHNDPEHLNKLIKALDYNADFYIHIDKKANIKEFEDVISLNNVFFLSNRVNVHWAGISMVDVLMNLIEEALKNENEYCHSVLITGSCYPLKNSKSIYDEFITNPKKNYINFIDVRDSPEHYMKLVKQKWYKEPMFAFKNKNLRRLDAMVRFLLNKLKLRNHWDEKIIPYMGHTWCALSMTCCKYVFEYHLNNPWFREMNRYTMAADEHYIHTIVGNSIFKQSTLGVAKYKGRGLYQYTSIYLIDKSLTKWYDLNDWEEIEQSEMLFVRKINSKTGNELVDKINSELL